MNPLALVDSLFMLLLIGGVSVLVLGFITALYAKLMLGWLAQIDVDFRDSFMAMLIAWFGTSLFRRIGIRHLPCGHDIVVAAVESICVRRVRPSTRAA